MGAMKEVAHETDTYCREVATPPADPAIAALASAQHAIVDVEDLRALGLSDRAILHRVALGRLHRLYRGVYAVGHTVLTREGRWLAAVRAYGRGARLSYRSCAAHLGLRDTSAQKIDVTVPSRSGHTRPGICLHRCRSLAPEDVDVVNGIPCTTVAKTILDLADCEPRRSVERLIDQAEILRVFDLDDMHAAIARASGRRGPALVTSILADYEIGENMTRNELEEAMLAICGDIGAPRPEINVWVPLVEEGNGIWADFLWRDPRVIAETDGRGSHGTRHAFEWDRVRDRQLDLAGWRVLRFTKREVFTTPEVVASDLTKALGLAPGREATAA
jgi:Protein of unknown function (DUF559)/Transcriptional regulator, AbiEi antitoxin